MLEIGIDLLIQNHVLVLVEACLKNKEFISFELIVNRSGIAKRLIRLEKSAFLSIKPDWIQNHLTHLAVVPVTSGFAKKRMAKKLSELHPLYKNKINKEIFLLHPIDKVWSDYCNLFGTKKELFSYREWISEFDSFNETDFQIDATIRELRNKPSFELKASFTRENLEHIEEFISSATKQSYKNWTLIISVSGVLEDEYLANKQLQDLVDRRVKIIFTPFVFDVKSSINSDWTILLESGGVLANHALFFILYSIITNPECNFFYSDYDRIDSSGMRSDPHFKTNWDPDRFYVDKNLIPPVGVFRTSILHRISFNGHINVGLESFSLNLGYIELIYKNSINHIPRILFHSRKINEAIESNSSLLSADLDCQSQVLNSYFLRNGINALVEQQVSGRRVQYSLPSSLPLVSLIIPTRDGLQLLTRCIESIQSKTSYSNFEIIVVDNGSTDLATIQYMKKLASMPFVRVLHDNRPFNYSALNNSAVKVAHGEIIGLINNDVEVINAEWLSEMVSHALRPEVAAVGARLWYSDDTLQHAGVVLGIHGIAGHVHRFLPRHVVGYCGRANLVQSFSAVTAACLIVRKSVYEELGGLNETELKVACNDVDFCLRASEAGYKNIWTPYAELYHHESSSRGFDDTPEKQARAAKEVAYMKQRWGNALLNDPAYSPNLTLDSEDFGLAWPPRVPTLDDVLIAMQQASQASALIPLPTLQ